MRIVVLIILIAIFSCSDNSHASSNLHKAVNIEAFNKYLFSLEKINSKKLLDTLQNISDLFFLDTTIKERNRRGKLYLIKAPDIKYLVLEQGKDTIFGISLYKGQENINSVEYYPNGQVACKFSIRNDGVRDGKYFCFKEDGKVWGRGYYKNGIEVNDSFVNMEGRSALPKQ